MHMRQNPIKGMVNTVVNWTLTDPVIGKLEGKNVFIKAYPGAREIVRALNDEIGYRMADVYSSVLNEDVEYDNIMRYNRDELRHYYRKNVIEPASNSDIVIIVDSKYQPQQFQTLPAEKAALADDIDEEFHQIFADPERKIFCVRTEYPTRGYARTAGLSEQEYADIFFRACSIDYRKLSMEQTRITKILDGAKKLQIEGPNVDLTVTPENLTFRKSNGRFEGDRYANVPDGEVYIEVPEFGGKISRIPVSGFIMCSFPYLGDHGRINGVQIELEDGNVTGYISESLSEYLVTLAKDKKCVEVAFGMNSEMTKPLGSDLCIEKMNGTMHLGIGSDSIMHTDFTTSMTGAKIYELKTRKTAKGTSSSRRLLYENGKFLV